MEWVYDHFNPRSREGSDSAIVLFVISFSDFNPRSREGSDLHHFRQELHMLYISIHAPAKGATCHKRSHTLPSDISIHAPAKGATDYGTYHMPRMWISIHAPAKGATRFCPIGFYPAVISIHAPAKGAPCWMITSFAACGHFNPRSREGSDADTFIPFNKIPEISIHAPAKGATAMQCKYKLFPLISIHAPAKGATAASATFRQHTQDFNPRSREGSDLCTSHTR